MESKQTLKAPQGTGKVAPKVVFLLSQAQEIIF
jgi:hypothetical protein